MKMKKIAAATLAAALAVCTTAPAFAADLTQDTTTGTATVYATTDGQEGYNTFKVTIPAETKIDWKATEANIAVTAESKLAPKQYVKVTASSEKSALALADTDLTIAYTFANDTVQTTEPVVDAGTSIGNIQLAIDAGQWEQKLPAGRYADTITFTASVETNA